MALAMQSLAGIMLTVETQSGELQASVCKFGRYGCSTGRDWVYVDRKSFPFVELRIANSRRIGNSSALIAVAMREYLAMQAV